MAEFSAKAPIGTDSSGRPVTASREMFVFLSQLYQRTGGAIAPSNAELGQRQDVSEEDIWRQSPDAHEALRAVDELRQEIAAMRSDRDRLRAEIAELAERIEDIPRIDSSLPMRISQIEDRLQ